MHGLNLKNKNITKETKNINYTISINLEALDIHYKLKQSVRNRKQ